MSNNSATGQARRKPIWLKRSLPAGPSFGKVTANLRENRLYTVCEAAKCPNRSECFHQRTSTFLLMGPLCTRNCRFCAVEHGHGQPLDPKEPIRVAQTAKALGLSYVVLTSVSRDDLPDKGAKVFAQAIKAVKRYIPNAEVEVLVPDFQGQETSLQTVLSSKPNVLNHNIETVRRLSCYTRPEANYEQSLRVLSRTGFLAPDTLLKSGLMLGLGETESEVRTTLDDLLRAGCHVLTLGQYLQPSPAHWPVKRYLSPEEFEKWRKIALSKGFKAVASGPLVRSSYKARSIFESLRGSALTKPDE